MHIILRIFHLIRSLIINYKDDVFKTGVYYYDKIIMCTLTFIFLSFMKGNKIRLNALGNTK